MEHRAYVEDDVPTCIAAASAAMSVCARELLWFGRNLRHRRAGGRPRADNSISAADLDDSALKERIAGLEVIRDQAQADAERAQAILESSSRQAITPAMVRKFAGTARERMRIEGGGIGDHLRVFAQHVEVVDREGGVMGSKSDLLRALLRPRV